MSNVINRTEALTLINQAKAKSQFYAATYIKKDGSEREAQCHPNTQKHLKGGTATYNASNSSNIGYYDIGKKSYRCFNIERVTRLKVGGKEYTVK